MKFTRAYIPVGGGWSSPFCRWQGALSELSSLDLAVSTTKRALVERSVPAEELTGIVLGWTVPQPEAFYGASTIAAKIGAPGISGPMIAQACATSAAAIAIAAAELEVGGDALTLTLLADRTSNGPHMVWPSARGQGGAPTTEDWVLENFRRDPWTQQSMVATAEAVAAEGGFDRQQIDELTWLRYEQYASALDDDRSFQRRYMVSVEVPGRRGGATIVEADEGIHQTSPEALGSLKPASPDGVITFGSQTHPADGAAAVLVTTREGARKLGRDGAVARILGFGHARVETARMPKAPVPAAQHAIADAGVSFAQLDVVTTHNPFAVNDLWFQSQTGFPVERMNPYGCSLVYGHPQAPTGARAIVELIEALALRGGGTGLFTGCAAGDTGAAIVVRVE